jgi:hypothetical protein
MINSAQPGTTLPLGSGLQGFSDAQSGLRSWRERNMKTKNAMAQIRAMIAAASK